VIPVTAGVDLSEFNDPTPWDDAPAEEVKE